MAKREKGSVRGFVLGWKKKRGREQEKRSSRRDSIGARRPRAKKWGGKKAWHRARHQREKKTRAKQLSLTETGEKTIGEDRGKSSQPPGKSIRGRGSS